MKKLMLSLLLTLLLSVSAFAAGKGIDVKVELSPAGSFHITSSKVKGKLVKKGKTYTGSKLYIKVKDMKTGIDLRDEHTRKRIGGKKAKVIVTKVKASGGKGKGIIEVKGIKKPFKFTYKESGKMLKVSFKLNLKHFKIKDLSYAGIGAEEIVKVKANIPVK